MAYGDYSGPDKAGKGKENGSCNRTLCQASPAIWYNHGSFSWYCGECKEELERINKREWDLSFRPKVGHAMFETREMMDKRKNV